MNNQEASRSNSGPGSALIVLMAMLIFGIMFMWNFRHNDIVYLWLRFDRLLALPFRNVFSKFNESILLLKAMNSRINIVTFNDMLKVTSAICTFYVPVALIVPLYGFYRAWRQSIRKLNITHSAETLLHRLNAVFPDTTPILNKNLIFDNDPKWKSAAKPFQYAIRNGILKDRVFDAKQAEKLFKEQVGLKFTSVDKLKDHEKALMAVFMARVEKNNDEAQDALDELSRSCAKTKDGNPNFACAFSLFNKHQGQIKKFLRVNKYVRTMICSMFNASKIRGGIAPSRFLWLKPIDRTLWYALNRVGASTPFAEAQGVWNCWIAEQVAFTGHLPISLSDWVEYFTEDQITGKVVWDEVVPAYELTEIWVKDAVQALKISLFESGLID